MPRYTASNQAEAKTLILAAIRAGATVAEACKQAKRTPKTYENWRAADPEFKAAVDAARVRIAKAEAKSKDPELYSLTFAEWRKRFLNQDTYPHQQMWIDVLEGREPKVWHPSIQYRKGSDRLVIINTPPFHAKSATVTQEYVTYKLCMNPAYRVVIISETATAAEKFLFSIKQMLTSPDFIELQLAYGPDGGFRPKSGDGRWGAHQIYLSGRGEDAVDKAAKDPSVQIVGVGGQIYGARADLIILDDAVSDNNVNSFEKQFDWLTRTVMSRAKTGKILVIGTRIAGVDLYSHLLRDDVYTSGKSPWTYIGQPAVLGFADRTEDWLTLWPRSSRPLDEAADEQPDENGMYRAWDGPALAEVRGANRPGIWALVYMQQQVDEHMTFPPSCVWGSVDKRRKPGPLRAGALGHPYDGDEGMRKILSVDPAGTGEAFLLHMCVDRTRRYRWVSNCWTATNTKPSWYLERFKEIHAEYGIEDLVIESNAYSSWLIHDEAVVAWARDNGIRIMSHFTQHNKTDPDFGVASMANLFGTTSKVVESATGGRHGSEKHNGDNVIWLPDPGMSPGVKALIDGLLIWVPGKRGGKLRQDGPMALWFAELRARTYLTGGDRPPQTHVQNRFLPRRARSRQYVIPATYAS